MSMMIFCISWGFSTNTGCDLLIGKREKGKISLYLDRHTRLERDL